MAALSSTKKPKRFNAINPNDFLEELEPRLLLAVAAPSGLVASTTSSTVIDLTWKDNSNNETGFTINESLNGTNFSVFLTDANATSYSADGLRPNTRYWFYVTAYNKSQRLANSNTVIATTFATTFVTPPAAPTGLSVLTASTTSINLTWADKSTNESGFNINESTDGVNFKQIYTTAANATSYSVIGLAPNTPYWFYVTAFNTGGSNSSITTTAATPKNIPSAPSGLSAAVVSQTQLNLAWTSNSGGYEDGFYIDRATDSAFTQNLITAVAGPNVTSYNATALKDGTTYYFRVSAYTNGGRSASSETASATTRKYQPARPSLLGAVAVSPTQINLAWTSGSAGYEDGFYIDRATDIAFSQHLTTTTVGSKVTTYSAMGLDPGTTYYFRVCAYTTGWGSAHTAPASATTLAGTPIVPTIKSPAAPSALVALATTDTQIDLAWVPDVVSNQNGFYVDRATDSGFTQNLVTTTLGASAASYSSTDLTANTQYYFRVRAYTNAGSTANSPSASATTRKRVVTIAAGQDLRTAIANAQSGDVLQLSAGTYLVDPSTAGGGPLVPPDNVTIQGVGTSTIIKVKDNVGDFLTLFGGWTKGGYMLTVNGFALRNLNVDLNPAGYGGDPARNASIGNAMASAILLSQFNGMEVAGVDFTYGSISCIDLAGYATLAQNAIVTGSTFRYVPVGAGKYDHSGLYFECLNQFAINNVFTGQPSAAIAAGSALELHGGPGAAIGNQITGIFTGINVCASYSVTAAGSPSGNMLVESNTMTNVNLGIEFWSDPIVPLRNVMVTNNVIHVGNNDWSGLWPYNSGWQWSAGIAMQPDQTGAFDGITVTKNLIDFQNETQPVCVFLTSGIILYTHAGLVTNCIAVDNTVINLPPSAV